MAVPSELLVERDGHAVAVLDDPRLDDMFWLKWRMTAIPSDSQPSSDVFSNSFWHDSHMDTTVFRCKASGQVADAVIWAWSQAVCDGRLVLRGAYVPVAVGIRQNPILWLKLLLTGGGAFDQRTPAAS
jgi:hypothetical protein